MIDGFEQITCELTEAEKPLVDVFIARFQKRQGKNNVVTNSQIREGIQTRYGVKLSEPRIRKIVQHIRVNNLLPGLIATSTGYYYTTNVREIQTWIDSMKQRERAIAESRMMMEKHLELIRSGPIQTQLKIAI